MKTFLFTFASASFFAAAVGQSCDDVPTESYLDQSGDNAQTYDTIEGLYQGRRTWYWEFGPRSTPTGPDSNPASEVLAAPIYVPVFENGESAGSNVIDVLPCEENYSDLWRVTRVIVQDGVEADSLTSRALFEEAVSNGNATLEPTDMLVNCPVAPFGSTIENSSPSENVPRPQEVEGWYQEERVFYYDFGGVASTTTAPIYAPVDADGEPAGLNIIDVIPGDEGYTPFWALMQVEVPEDSNTELESQEDVEESGFEMNDAGAIVNCPVAFTEEVEDESGDDDDEEAAGSTGTNAGSKVHGMGLALVGAVVGLMA